MFHIQYSREMDFKFCLPHSTYFEAVTVLTVTRCKYVNSLVIHFTMSLLRHTAYDNVLNGLSSF